MADEEQPQQEQTPEESVAEQKEDQSMIDAGGIDLPEVFNKMITPKSEEQDKDITRDLKLTKLDDNQTEFIFRLKAIINLCGAFGLEDAKNFYKSLHDYYINARSADDGFTAKNIVTTRHMLTKTQLGEKKGGFFR